MTLSVPATCGPCLLPGIGATGSLMGRIGSRSDGGAKSRGRWGSPLTASTVRARARIDADQSAYPPTGFLPTNVVTSTPGCYRLTGTLKGTRDDSKLRVVIKID